MPVSRHVAAQRQIDQLQSMLDMLNAPVPENENDDAMDAAHEEYEQWCEEHTTRETWLEVTNAILTATRDAFPLSPSVRASSIPEQEAEAEAFRAYWRRVFRQLLEKVNSDASIPEFVTDPPRDNLSVYLLADIPHDEVHCTVYLPQVAPSIYISDPDGVGVRKGGLVAALGEYLYGLESLGDPSSTDSEGKAVSLPNSESNYSKPNTPQIYHLGAYNTQTHTWPMAPSPMPDPLVYGMNWMCPSHFESEVQSLSGRPKVWLFCANANDFPQESENDAQRRHWFDPVEVFRTGRRGSEEGGEGRLESGGRWRGGESGARERYGRAGSNERESE
ncbi:hypothetical protein OQA88_2104 [Cercophora sp. LCS_1]